MEIVQKDNPVLHSPAETVSADFFGSAELTKILADMKKALDSQDDGAAIAAPQIAVPLRIFMISERVFGEKNEKYGGRDPHFVFINPEITKLSKKTKVMDEGCLSVRGYYGNVRRHLNATIRAYDEDGNVFTRGAGGLLSQVFQHECDHLNGKLFTDRASEVWEVEYKNQNSNLKNQNEKEKR